MEPFHEDRSYAEGINVSISKSNSLEFLAHWHVDIEILYVCEGSIRVGIIMRVEYLQRENLRFVLVMIFTIMIVKAWKALL